jgi:hypothetical protein
MLVDERVNFLIMGARFDATSEDVYEFLREWDEDNPLSSYK